MSTGPQSPNDIPSSRQIIQQRIDSMRQQNDIANTSLDETLQQMREQLNLGQSWTPPTGPPVPVDNVLLDRLTLSNSQWASQVIYAAALDEEFKEQTGQRAREILIANNIPTAEVPVPEGEAPSDDEQA